MPTYRYKCSRCSKTKDEFRKIASRDEMPSCCPGATIERVLCAAMVQGDIEPYKSVTWDKETKKCPYIASRKQHREFMARNDLVEIGNEPFKPSAPSRETTSNDTYELGDL